MIRVFSLVTQSVNFDAKTFVFLEYVLSENDTSFEQNNNLVYSQICRKAVKFSKCLVWNFKQISHLP